MGLSSAPSVIACVGPDDDTVEQRIGYYGEKLVISIAIGYGADKGKPHKSKTMDQVVEAKGDRPFLFNKGVEMALLAPTAINQQKLKIRLNEDETVDFIDKGGMFSQVNLGIVRCHREKEVQGNVR